MLLGDALPAKPCGCAAVITGHVMSLSVAYMVRACRTFGLQLSDDLFPKLCNFAGKTQGDLEPQEVEGFLCAWATLGLQRGVVCSQTLYHRAWETMEDFGRLLSIF